MHGAVGGINLTEDFKLQHFLNRSASPRPRVVRAASGARVMVGRRPAWLPRVAPTPVRSGRPGAVRGWTGLSETDNAKYAGFSIEPPDQGLCAGGGRVMEMINEVVRVDSRNGVPQRTALINDFFGEPASELVSDPSCVFDGGNHRFYASVVALDVDTDTGDLTGRNHLDLAVSKTSDPRRGWFVYRIDATDDGSNGTPSHPDCPCIGDFPHLATDSHGVFLTTNEYPLSDAPGLFGNGFNGAQVYAVSKSLTAAGARHLPLVHFQNLQVPATGRHPRVGFTLWPAQAAGTGYARAGNGTIYFISSFAAEEARPADFTGHAGEIGAWWVSNTRSLDSTPLLRLHEKTLQTRPYGVPPLSNQKAGPVPLRDCVVTQCEPKLGSSPYLPEQEGSLDSSDSRPLTAVYAHGTVLAALDTAMQVSGNVQAGFEWFDVRARRGHSSLAGNGYVGVSQGNAIYPAIVTNPAGRGYVGFTLAGRNWYPSAGYASWLSRPGPAVHILAAGAAPEDGFCEYLTFNCAGTPVPAITPRWGDYGYGAWDSGRFYLGSEYIAHSCTFARFAKHHSCGGTRTFGGNFATHIHRLS